jgi:hypothetical protein
MGENWKVVKATDVKVGDVVRVGGVHVVKVSRIEQPFLGRADRLAFIEDTDERWFKAPAALEGDVEVLGRI